MVLALVLAELETFEWAEGEQQIVLWACDVQSAIAKEHLRHGLKTQIALYSFQGLTVDHFVLVCVKDVPIDAGLLNKKWFFCFRRTFFIVDGESCDAFRS